VEAEPPPGEFIPDLGADQQVLAELGAFFWAALNGYIESQTSGDAAQAWEWRERTAAEWRRTVELRHLEAYKNGFWPEPAIELYGVLESSLVLLGCDHPEQHELGLSPPELFDRVVPFGEAVFLGWHNLLNIWWREQEHVAGRQPSDRPSGWPDVPTPPKRPRRTARGLADEWVAAFRDASLTFSDLYRDLAPNAQAVGEQDRAVLLDQIRATAALDRTLDLASANFSGDDWATLSLMAVPLRMLTRSAALALSADSDRRHLAMDYGEFQQYAFVTARRLQGRSIVDAWRDLAAVPGSAGASAPG
jgi:hypothetical protein